MVYPPRPYDLILNMYPVLIMNDEMENQRGLEDASSNEVLVTRNKCLGEDWK